GNAVKLVIRSDFGSCVLDNEVTQHTGVVIIIIAAVPAFTGTSLTLGSYGTFSDQCQIRISTGIGTFVGNTKPVNDHATPLTHIFWPDSAKQCIALRRNGDGRISGTVGPDL